MNVFNRVLVSLVSLAVAAAALAVLLVAVDVATPADLAPTQWLADRLTPFTDLDNADQAWTVGVCGALILLALVLLFLELKPPHRERQLVLRQDELGRVTVDPESIAALVNREATLVPGVMEGRARVKEDHGQLRIHERVSVDPSAQLPELTQALRERVKAAVEHHLGRPVADLQVETQVQPLERRRRVR